ncbi:MAG: isoprenylcysteine carboxylmethyltransferase family protein, partial [Proteobacteria bacterium]|nr:isoprenylcysteine carboxylmethyltransferase family protein [Pseudomonadota bacterium]
AQTRSDHVLVQNGPFRWIRNPIYVALGLFMVAMAIAFGHWRNLMVAVPLYAVGTWMRVMREEALLRTQFGVAYDDYIARVKRFVPGLF